MVSTIKQSQVDKEVKEWVARSPLQIPDSVFASSKDLQQSLFKDFMHSDADDAALTKLAKRGLKLAQNVASIANVAPDLSDWFQAATDIVSDKATEVAAGKALGYTLCDWPEGYKPEETLVSELGGQFIALGIAMAVKGVAFPPAAPVVALVSVILYLNEKEEAARRLKYRALAARLSARYDTIRAKAIDTARDRYELEIRKLIMSNFAHDIYDAETLDEYYVGRARCIFQRGDLICMTNHPIGFDRSGLSDQEVIIACVATLAHLGIKTSPTSNLYEIWDGPTKDKDGLEDKYKLQANYDLQDKVKLQLKTQAALILDSKAKLADALPTMESTIKTMSGLTKK